MRNLLARRRKLDPLRRRELVELTATDATDALARVTPKRSVVVAFNTSTQPQTLEREPSKANLASANALTDRPGGLGRLPVQNGSVKLVLPPRSAAVLTQSHGGGGVVGRP